MQMRFLVVATVVAISIPQSITAQVARPAATGAAPAAICVALSEDWRRVEQNLAMNLAKGLRVSPSLRAMEDSNELAIAAMTLELMREARCTLPRRAPSAATYIGAAMACEASRSGAGAGARVPQCERATWARTE